MAIYDFEPEEEKFVTIDQIPDHRTDTDKKLTPMSIYNHDKPDVAMAERWAEELVNISGAWVSVFLKRPEPPIENNVWDEDPDPNYESGRLMKAYFKPETVEFQLLEYGIDIPLKATVVFARAVLVKEIGNRMLVPGDVIELPYNDPQRMNFFGTVGPLRFRINNAFSSGMFLYRWLYLTAECELLTGDEAVKVRLPGIGKRKL